tara:strand:- start:152 stop:1072 length:921 start_codon:yes stop_codon:yes gene_type:complete
MEEIHNFTCKICNKCYKHRQSLYKHIKTKHNTTSNNNLTTLEQQHNTSYEVQTSNHIIKCKYCNKVFNHNQSKYRHQKTCKERFNHNDKTTKYISIEQYEADMEKEMKKLSNMLIKKFKKLLKEEKIGDNICNNIGNQLNDHAIGTQNNITIVSLGKEDVLNTLSQNEKINILEKRYMSVLELIKLMHCSDKYPQFNNSIITNLRSRQALTFDEESGKFVSTNKDDLMKNIVSHRTSDVEDILDENKEDVSNKTQLAVEDIIDILSDIDNKQNTNYVKEYTENAMIAIYNDKDRLSTNKKQNEITE